MHSNENASFPGTIDVDLDAIGRNLQVLQRRAPKSSLMAVVKANAYGHGRLPVARAALRAGVTYFGVSQVSEAIQFRKELDGAGFPRPAVQVFTWLAAPEQDWEEALLADLELSASSVAVLDRIAGAAKRLEMTAPVHLKVDVGMSRGGAVGAQVGELMARAAELEQQGSVEVRGVWSHLPQADDVSPSGKDLVRAQVEKFTQALAAAHSAGLEPKWRHLAATAGTLWHPETHFNLVRVGIGMYGLSPDPHVQAEPELNLTPALALSAPLTLVKRIPKGAAVSYGGTWTAPEDHWVGLVPLGYADGIPRHASNCGPVTVYGPGGDKQTQIIGRVCMDQVVISLGSGAEPEAEEGDRAVLIGPAPTDPSADDWADACQTINYEIVTRLAPTIRRVYSEEGNGR